MAEVLYRKYRSQTFDELIGQAHITDILKNAVRSGMISHAYLMVGSRGTGKTSTARILAKALNCTDLSKDGNPCNKCEACKAVTSGTFLDLIEIDAASNRGIDQIRELKERIEYAPSEGRYKVYIIDEVHMLTTEAFNALLKTLEEPPPHVVFILATTDVHKLPATILSRCQRYDFHLGTDVEVEAVIRKAADNEGVKLADQALALLVQNANGSYRDALSLLDVVVSGQAESKKPKEVSDTEVRRILGIPDSTMVYYLLEKLTMNETVECIALINELDSKGVNLQQFVKFVLIALREILVLKLSGKEDGEYSFAESLDTREILQMMNLFIEADRKLRTAPLPALILEMVVAEMFVSRSGTTRSTASPTSPQIPPKNGVNKRSDQKSASEKDLRSASDKDQTQSGQKGSKSALNQVQIQDEDQGSEEVQKVDTRVGQKKGRDNDEKLSDKQTQDQDEKPSVEHDAQQSEKHDVKSTTEQPQTRADKGHSKKEDGSIGSDTNDHGTGSAQRSNDSFDPALIEQKWGEITKNIQRFNGHLYAFLKAAKVAGSEGGYLLLEVPFEFHKDRIEAPRSREALNEVFKEVVGSTIAVRCKVNESIQRKKPSSADVVLKSIQNSANAVVTPPSSTTAASKQESTSPQSKAEPAKKRRISKKVEAIFADL